MTDYDELEAYYKRRNHTFKVLGQWAVGALAVLFFIGLSFLILNGLFEMATCSDRKCPAGQEPTMVYRTGCLCVTRAK